MINYLNGIVKASEEQKIVVEVGSVGVALQVPSERSFMVGSQVTVQTYMHWNAEQGPSLFGFATDLERTVFLLVISCSGIGPKIALAILDHMSPQAFLEAINLGNEAALSKVSGIGAKKAEQMIVQLRQKVAKLIKSGVEISQGSSFEQWNNVSEVLESLNYTRSEITQTMKFLGDSYAGQQVDFDQLMRHALSFLSRKTV